MHGLPSELWTTIIDLLSRTDTRTCLHVNRVFRDSARRRLFRSIHLNFGDVRIRRELEAMIIGPPVGNPSEIYDLYVGEATITQKACDILDCIIGDPTFARLVMEITVHADERNAAVFGCYVLARAIRALSNLKSFAWSGDCPPVPDSILETLGAYTSLTSLDICEVDDQPSPWARMSQPVDRAFSALKSLTYLSFEPSILVAHYEGTTSGMLAQILAANKATLRHLAISDVFLSDLPLRMFDSLVRLDIISLDAATLDEDMGLPLILRHVPSLEELFFAYTSDFMPIFPKISDEKDAMPRLRSFGMVWEGITVWGDDEDEIKNHEQYRALVDFLHQRRATLRRLRLDFGCGSWAILRELLEGLARLTSLEVIGLYLPSYLTDHVELFHVLSTIFSDRLFAFSLLLTWDPSSLHADDILPLMSRLALLPRLTFLHIGLSRETTYHFPPEDIAHEMSHLTTLALGELHIWDIGRRYIYEDEVRSVEVTIEKWSHNRVDTRTADDFGPGGEDYTWLLRRIACHSPGE